MFVTLRKRFYLYLSRMIGLRIINGNAFVILFVKNLCSVGSAVQLQFYDILGQFLQNNTNYYVCYSAEYILFILNKNYWPQSKANAFEILFVKNLCRDGTTFPYDFVTFQASFYRKILIIMFVTLRKGFYLYLSIMIGLRIINGNAFVIILSRTCAGSGRLFSYNFMTFWASFYRAILIIWLLYVEQSKFIFIKNIWPQSKGNAFDILFVKYLCRVGTTFRLRFCDIFRPVSIEQ